MLNENLYKVITESLQDDINSGNVSYEYANVINDIAYKAYIEREDLNENIRAVLDRYISESVGGDSVEEDYHYAYEYYDSETDDEAYIEACKSFEALDNVINTMYSDVVSSISNIMEAYANGEIDDHDFSVLYESVDTREKGHEYFVEKGNASEITSKVKAWAANAKKKINEVKKDPKAKKTLKGAFASTLIAGAMIPGQSGTASTVADNLKDCYSSVVHEIDQGDFGGAIKEVDYAVSNIIDAVRKDLEMKGINVKYDAENIQGHVNPKQAKSHMLEEARSYNNMLAKSNDEISSYKDRLKKLEGTRRKSTDDANATKIHDLRVKQLKYRIAYENVSSEFYKKVANLASNVAKKDGMDLIKARKEYDQTKVLWEKEILAKLSPITHELDKVRDELMKLGAE